MKSQRAWNLSMRWRNGDDLTLCREVVEEEEEEEGERVHNKAPQRYILSTRAMDKKRFEMLWSPSQSSYLTAEAAQGRRSTRQSWNGCEPLLHSWNLIPGRDEHEISSSRKITPCIVVPEQPDHHTWGPNARKGNPFSGCPLQRPRN